jgi:hypothetical protein
MSEIATETFEPIYDSFDATVVSEMAQGAQVLLPLDPETVARVTEGDNDPKFATFLIESGWSKQRNYWGPEVFESVQEQINNATEPIVGYLGHIPPEQDGFAFPDIQLQWLKSKLQISQDKVKMLVKAYVLPETRGRDYLKRGLVRSVSWRGDCLKKPIQGGVAIKDFALESIDLSRPRKAGMQAALVGGLTSEMEEGRQDVKPDEIGALTANELRAHNPTLVTAIEDEAKKPLEEKVSEQATTIEAAKPELDLIPEIRKLLGMAEDGDILDVLGQTMTQLKEAGRTAKDAILDKVIRRKFKDEGTAKLVKRLIASEMDGIDLSGDVEKDEEAISTKVNEMVDNDADLKEMVSEMEEGRTEEDTGRTRESDNGARGNREIKEGYSNDRISVRAARR